MGKRVDENVLDAFEISNNAAKIIDYQVSKIAKEHLQIGVARSKFSHKHCEAQGIERPTSHDRGQNCQIHSWAEYDKFKSAITSLAHFCNAEFGLRRVTDISPKMVSSFLGKVSQMGYSKNSVNGFITQIEKLASFCNMPLHDKAIVPYKQSDAYMNLEKKDTETRAYAHPERIIDALGSVGSREDVVEKMQFSASLSLNYGLRINDACHFKTLPDSKILYNSKNGMRTVKVLASEDHTKAKSLSENGKYNLSVNTIKAAWGKACDYAGENRTGLHGLRHNFAQNLYSDLRDRGLTHKEACLVCSKELNHSRPEITERYLR